LHDEFTKVHTECAPWNVFRLQKFCLFLIVFAAMLQNHKGQWRARLQFKIGNERSAVLGPCRIDPASAEHDLRVMQRAKQESSLSGRAAFEAVSAVAAELRKSSAKHLVGDGGPGEDSFTPPSQQAEVEALARMVSKAMENGNRKGALDALMALLRHPASLDDGIVDGRTLLAEAVRWNCHDVVDALLEHGANPNALCSSGLTPLHMASMSGKLHLMHALVAWGADPNIPDAAGLTPLRRAILTAPVAAVAGARELLLSVGARETAVARQEMAARLAADKNDLFYLVRFRGDGVAPPASGVAAHCA